MSSNTHLFDTAAQARLHRWRHLKDILARHGIAFGGVSVIIAIVLIFFYLFYVVYPLFLPASAKHQVDYPLPGPDSPSLLLDIDELNEMAVRYIADGEVIFFRVENGETVETIKLPVDGISAVGLGKAGSRLVALGLGNGSGILVKHGFKVSYPEDIRTVSPSFEYPYGEIPLELDEQGASINHVAVNDGEERLLIAVGTADGRMILNSFNKETSMLDEEVTLEREVTELAGVDIDVEHIMINFDQRHLYLADGDGTLLHFDISDIDEASLVERVNLLPSGVELTSLQFLVGSISLLAGGSDGRVVQWFPARDEHNNYVLQQIRSFTRQQAPIRNIKAEERRKGFIAADTKGNVGIYHTTAERNLLLARISEQPLRQLALSPRADYMLAESENSRLFGWTIHNEHPEVSWHSLWEKVHYEGYTKPEYIWQSSSADNDFEPKFSLTPLSFGTLKAAFYAMLFAVPLAILGAIYTAYFMAPSMRQFVKPSIEIMEALPTVILGFLAGLWLAPLIEAHLPGIFSMLLIMPIGILLFGYFWQHTSGRVKLHLPEGWEGALLLPVVVFLGWLSMMLSQPLEQWLFNGDMRSWLYNDLGIDFDQRNSLVVGLAMGFAVIPTIFSITEDAVFGVPKHLTFGSLALGASRWQTLAKVVILTASPGIFSAVMIGLGRAVGETMIVLMATGNTPVMDINIFQGMRTLSANIAVEMPESEVASTHYRVLFLAALVLFMFTFFFNTLAEIIRQRLRKKYASL